jgi:hypothetical protein
MARPFKIYPNQYFWFENMPSGNPGLEIDIGGRYKSNKSCHYIGSKRYVEKRVYYAFILIFTCCNETVLAMAAYIVVIVSAIGAKDRGF